MSKRGNFEVDGLRVSPNKYLKMILGENRTNPFKVPASNENVRQRVTIQELTPERSPDDKTSVAESSSTTACRPDSAYVTPVKYENTKFVRNLGTGGQARAVLMRTPGVGLVVAKYFKKEKYCVRESRVIRAIHVSGSKSNSGHPHYHIENHDRIVGIIDGPFNDFPHARVGDNGKEWTILLDYCPGGTLRNCKNEYLNQSRAVPEMLIWKYFLQIAEALAFLHWGYGTDSFDPDNPYARDYSFVHRDLKPCNILRKSNLSVSTTTSASSSDSTSTDPYPDIKICDFGMSAKVPKSQFQDARTGGSEFWQPPEQCQSPHLAGPAQDIWALGAIIHYLALGEPPCDGTKGISSLEGGTWRAALPRAVTPICVTPKDRKATFRYTIHNGRKTEFSSSDMAKKWGGCYSKMLNYWMSRCLQLDAGRRATALEIVRDLGGVYYEILEKCKGNPAGFAKRVRNMRQ